MTLDCGQLAVGDPEWVLAAERVVVDLALPDGPKSLDVCNPASGETVARLADQGPDEALEAVDVRMRRGWGGRLRLLATELTRYAAGTTFLCSIQTRSRS